MKKTLIYLLGITILLLISGFIYYKTQDESGKANLKRTAFELTHNRDAVAEKEAYTIAYNAYLYGFSRVKGLLLEQKATHPKYQDFAPINQFHISKELAKPGFTDFTPNCDTFYGLAWLDVSQGPILLTLPEIPEKYYTIQATDAGLNTFDYIGSRVKSEAGVYAYCKNDWQGELPEGVMRIDCPTNQVFLQARNLVKPGDEADSKSAYELMMKYTLEPLNKEAVYKKIDAGSEIVNPLNTNPDLQNLNFYGLLNEALTRNPPLAAEKNLVGQFESLLIGPNMIFDISKLSPSQITGMEDGRMAAFRKLYDELKFGGEKLGGFNFRFNMGNYGANYPLCAAVAFYGYGANTAQEAMYVTAIDDSEENRLSGKNKYKIHFTKDQIPPVHAFWSITMYLRPDNQLVENEIERYNIGGLTPGLKINSDGSLDIEISHEKPAKVSNWLPAPKGDFWLILRMYHPKEEVLNGSYKSPEIIKL
ncbi:MAG: hypothetical protein ACI9IP_000015 [Arcticibacterium sp.]|jgi:hypothetical protein